MSPDLNDTSWNSNVQSTPGVIGAQEVYRLVSFFFNVFFYDIMINLINDDNVST